MQAPHLPQVDNRGFQIRISLFFGLIAFALFLLLLRAWYLQIVQGEYYLELSENNRLRVIETPPPRGRIYDRNGSVLVNNPPSNNLYVVLGDMPAPEEIIPRLAKLIGMPPDEISDRLKKNKRDLFLPVKIKEDLTMREVAQIEGHRLDLPGVNIQSEFKRDAVYGALAAHLIGYVGEVTQKQLASGKYEDARGGSIIGQYGVEQTYDAILRGTRGRKRIEVDALGYERSVVEVTPPVQGDDIFLTLDLDVQRVAEEALAQRPGAIVAMDPRNGEILAMVSHPTFNPNMISRGISSKAWKALLEDTKRPLTNRVIHGQYPPASTYKIVMGAAILESKIASTMDKITCKGFIRFAGRTYRDWKWNGHGQVDLHRSLVESCDVYYYEMGAKLGVDTISQFSYTFGLGRPTGIELAYEKGGLIPTSEWKKRVYKERWFPGETLSISIGQGFVLTTPIQLAAMISAIAADGVMHSPQLLKKIRRHTTQSFEAVPSSKGRRLPISSETIRAIQSALAGVVSDPKGTAKTSRSKLVSMGGKTGTAQVVARPEDDSELPAHLNDHAWFVAYAPVDDPEIAVVVLVENGGHGGSTAAPLARKIIEAYFGEPEEPITTEDPRSAIGSWDKPPSRLKDKARGHKDDRSVLTRTVRSLLTDNAVLSDESAVSNSAIAELGEEDALDLVRKEGMNQQGTQS
ncbi:MAG: penicillin-binding protein 2 [Nitrospira sp.]|nr:penicillin-binding protein 2 [Candidatus Manganitrophaceae bacterium]HIL35074.1 penicillin-binding protein 2 [Candidatus Manganitrophaceae bacterium]